jgi:general stress protein CsbA
MWGLLLVLGQNEIFAGELPELSNIENYPADIAFLTVARNPFLILLLALIGAGMYVTYNMNLWGPIIQMTTAAWAQGLQIAKAKLREWLQETETGRQAIAMSSGESIELQNIRRSEAEKASEDEVVEI